MDEILDSKLYSADCFGRVYSHHFGKRKRVKLFLEKQGYQKFNFSLPNRKVTLRVHRFVWSFFYGSIPQGLQINHINHDKKDNRIANLELVSQKENIRKAVLAGRPVGRGNKNGSKNPRAKLTECKARNIYRSSLHYAVLAERYGVSTSVIYDIKRKKTWGHIHG